MRSLKEMEDLAERVRILRKKMFAISADGGRDVSADRDFARTDFCLLVNAEMGRIQSVNSI